MQVKNDKRQNWIQRKHLRIRVCVIELTLELSSGRQFDKNGNMKEWWNNATILAFKKQTQCIIDQYSSYKIEEIDMNLNGLITQGENIADNGGLKQAFRVQISYCNNARRLVSVRSNIICNN